VVAADDGVMPQTIEAINHARAAEVPILVAVTKVDREDSDPTRVRQQLVERELVPEAWGGDTIVVDVAPPAGIGVDELLESILLMAEVEELAANPKTPARALVLESNLDQGRDQVVIEARPHGFAARKMPGVEQDRYADAALAQGNGLRLVGDGDAIDTGLYECCRHLMQAKPVGVPLERGEDPGARARRPRGQPPPRRAGLAVLDRADAPRRPRGDVRHR